MPNVGPASPQVAVNSELLARIIHTSGVTKPGLLQCIDFKPTGTASLDIDILVEDKFEVVDVIIRKDGAGLGNTVQIKNLATAITDAIVAATDKAVTRVGTIDTAQNVIAAGGTLRCSSTFAAGTINSLVTVVGIVRP